MLVLQFIYLSINISNKNIQELVRDSKTWIMRNKKVLIHSKCYVMFLQLYVIDITHDFYDCLPNRD